MQAFIFRWRCPFSRLFKITLDDEDQTNSVYVINVEFGKQRSF